MNKGPEESIEEFEDRLRKNRNELLIGKQLPPIKFHLKPEFRGPCSMTSSAFLAMDSELKAIQATKWFRLRESLVQAKRRVLGAANLPPAASTSAHIPDSIELEEEWFDGYAEWVNEVSEPSWVDGPFIDIAIRSMVAKPVIGIVVAAKLDELGQLSGLIEALRVQFYQEYFVSIAVFCDSANEETEAIRLSLGDKGTVVLIGADFDLATGFNEAINLQPAEWLIALSVKDRLTRHALYEMAEAIVEQKNVELFYTDEDRLRPDGQECLPNFKPDWNELLLLSTNYLGMAVLLKKSRLLDVGGFRSGVEGAERWDLYLRYTENLSSESIFHLARVLFHAGEDPSADGGAMVRVATEATERRDQPASIEAGPKKGTLKVRAILSNEPLVSLVIPTKDHSDLLRACIESVTSVTQYTNYEFVIVDNGSSEPKALKYLEKLKLRPNVTVVRDPRPFNFSSLNNLGAYHSKGEILALLNNDIEVVEPDWMSQLVSHAIRPEVGIVGARLLYPDRTVQHAAIIVGLALAYAEHSFKGISENDGGYQNRAILDQWISAVTGACQFMRRELFVRLGGLDSEHFEVSYNDIDLCLKARALGYKNVYAGSVTLIHHESKTRGSDDNEEKVAAQLRSVAEIAHRWGAGFEDPYYNPNLEIDSPTFTISHLPRIHGPWYK
jgi:GT2 family glycosyltransferase